MADEKIGISVEVTGTGAGIKSVKELKNEVQKLEETASKADFGSDEFKKATESADDLKKKMGELSGDASKKLGNSLNDLKKQYKDLKVALSNAVDPKDFSRLSSELNDVEGKIGDINDIANLATGSGVEQLQKGIALVGEGFKNFDFEKTKIGFKGIATAMKGIPIFLIIEGIKFLIESFDGLTKSNGFLGEAFRFIGEIIDGVKQGFKDLADAIGLTTFAADEASDRQIKAAERLAEGVQNAGKKMESIYDRQIALAKAQGKSTIDLEKQKQNEIIKTSGIVQDQLLLQSKEIQKKYANDKEKRDEELKKINDSYKISIENQVNANNQLLIIEATLQSEKTEKAKKAAEDRKKIAEDESKFLKDKNKELLDDYNNYQKSKEDADKKAAEEKSKAEDLAIEAEIQADQKKFEADKKKREEDLADYKKAEAAKLSARAALEKASFDAAKNLSDAIFSIQIGNAKKGSAEELKLKKQQFNINKAFAVTQAIMDGRRAIQTVLASYPAPFNIPIAIATGISSAANIAKIASAKFDGGGASSGGGGGAAPQIGSTSLPTPPTINNPNNNTSTMFDAQGNNLGNEQRTSQQPIKVFVTETDISDIQNRANKLKTQTTI